MTSYFNFNQISMQTAHHIPGTTFIAQSLWTVRYI